MYKDLYRVQNHCTTHQTLCFATVNKEPFCCCCGLHKVNAVVVYKSHDIDISVSCLRFKPRNHWKIPSEQSCSACRFSHWKSLYHLPMEISRNCHRNFNLIEWKAPLELLNFGICSSIRQFAEFQTGIFHRLESAIDFSLYGACYLNCFSHFYLVILISI